MQKVRCNLVWSAADISGGYISKCIHRYNDAISESFHPSHEVLFTFPSRYLYAIGHQKCLGWDSGLPLFYRTSAYFDILKDNKIAFEYGTITL